MTRSSRELMLNAYHHGTVIPAFNIPYLPMVEPLTRALVDTNAFGFLAVARPEWERFEARSQAAVRDEYRRYCQEPWMRLHQDHVPVIDEDGKPVDYMAILQQAIDVGFDSLMVDGSRLPLAENIAATQQVVELAARYGLPVEAELGAVLGHEAGPMPPYEELFRTGQGFTDVDEATRFVQESGTDWLSVACGNIHGAIQGAAKDAQKVQARLSLEHLAKLKTATGVPLVLHGGSGIVKESILGGVANGIAKINIGTDVRQPYEQAMRQGLSVAAAQQAVYDKACWVLRSLLEVENSRDVINPA
jgi:fructose-bisphosphate aldolase, class II